MKNLIILFSIIFFFSSCEPTVVTFELEPHEPQLTVFGFLNPNLDKVNIAVGKSAGINDNPTSIVADATVQLIENGITVGTLDYIPTSNGNNNYVLDYEISSIPGTQYDLVVDYEGFETVTTTQLVPNKAIIDEIKDTGSGVSTEFGEELREFTLRFDDIQNEKNYYVISAYTYDTLAQYYPNNIYMESNDPDVSKTSYNIYNGLIFDDAAFENQTREVRVLIDDYEGFLPEHYVLQFRLHTISEDRYLFEKSYKSYNDADDDFFAEPVTLFSNIQDGFGIFSIEQFDKMDFVE